MLANARSAPDVPSLVRELNGSHSPAGPGDRRSRRCVQVNTSQCAYKCVVLPDLAFWTARAFASQSQCTCRCVVLPDPIMSDGDWDSTTVSMYLQVRGAP